MSSINDRIQQIIDKLFEGSTRDFSAKIDVNYQTIRNVVGERKSTPSSSIIQNIANSIEQINLNWLLSGKGEMLKEKKKNNDATPILSPNVMMIPLVSQYAHAGYLSGYGDMDYIEALPKIPIVADHELRGDYLSFEVRGDSMDDQSDDSLKEGDILVCRRIKHEYWKYKLHINKWDFVIVHRTEGILVKRIADHEVETGSIRLHSLNPLFSDTTLNLKDVSQLFNVVQVSRTRRR